MKRSVKVEEVYDSKRIAYQEVSTNAGFRYGYLPSL